MAGIHNRLAATVASLFAQVADKTVRRIVLSPQVATAAYSLNIDGRVYVNGVAGDTWLVAGEVANFEVRATFLSGAAMSGTFNAWQSLSSLRQWSLSRSTQGTSVSQIRIELRVAGGSTVISTALIDFEASVDA